MCTTISTLGMSREQWLRIRKSGIGAELTVVCPSGEYSASAIAHAVEDADAHLLNLNVVAGTQPNSPTSVILRVNHSRGDSVARSLARYGYDTVEMAGTPGLLNADMIERVNSLLHYLEV